ncbi:MAG: TrkH family potassium uptake protein [Oligoflexia bacterium]|nr:TrkH family potassium uptake protein [Oligoflexia bacterium]
MNARHILVVVKLISILMIIISFFMFIPSAIAVYNGEISEFYGFIIPILITLFLSVILLLMTRKNEIDFLPARSGFMLVTFSWIFASFLGAMPFYLSGAIPSFTNAFFETISGLTTTGASILVDIESLPRSLLFWRSLTHWLGGMGIVVFTVAILPLLVIGGLQLIKAEAPGPTVDKITPRITETAKILWFIYIGLTVAETLLLMAGGMSLFDSLTHTFGTLATGGFSPKNSSVGFYNSPYIDLVITTFMILAGINFVMHFRIITGKISDVWKDTEIKVYLTIFIISTALIAVFINGTYDNLWQNIRYAGFQAASILTTTGYATADFDQWPFAAKSILFALMFVGGCSGSTGGGIKVMRIVLLFKQGLNEMRYLIHPRGVFNLKLNGNTIKKDIMYSVSGFFFLYILVIIMVTLIVAASGAVENLSSSLTTALVTVGNIGPGFGRIGPSQNYAFFPDYLKWILSFAMLIGRLELYTVFVILTPRFWKR